MVMEKKTINFTHLQLEYRLILFHQDLHQQLCNSETEKNEKLSKTAHIGGNAYLLIWVQHIGFILTQHLSRSVAT